MLLGINPLAIGPKPQRFKPWLSTRCKGWFEAAYTQTYDATLYATGTTPPVITLSGAQTIFSPLGLRVECTTPGVRGTWLLRYSYDSGATFAHSGVTSAATIALDGIASGLTLNIAIGAAAVNDVWQLTTTAAAALNDVTNTLRSSAASTDPILLTGTSGILGRPAWSDQNASTEFISTSQLIPASPFFIYAVAQMNSGTGSFGVIYSGAAGSGLLPFLGNNGSGSNQLLAANGNNLVVAYTYGAPKRMVQSCQGTASDFIQVGATKSIGVMTTNASANGLALFVRKDLNAVTHLQGKIALWGIFSGDPATGNILAALDNYVATSGFTSGGAALFT